jgi:hypothetical protein
MSTQIDLLKQKCKLDQIDADTAHVRIPHDSEPKLPRDTRFALGAVEQMFLEDKDKLEHDIKKLH